MLQCRGKNQRQKQRPWEASLAETPGTIFQSYAAGTIKAIIIPIWWGLPLLALLLLLLFLFRPIGILPTFAPVPYDEDQIPIPGETVVPNTDGNFVSFQFEQDIDIALNTGMCNFQFKNPGNSNHDIMDSVQFTDAQAIRVMGSTGRSTKEATKTGRRPLAMTRKPAARSLPSRARYAPVISWRIACGNS